MARLPGSHDLPIRGVEYDFKCFDIKLSTVCPMNLMGNVHIYFQLQSSKCLETDGESR